MTNLLESPRVSTDSMVRSLDRIIAAAVHIGTDSSYRNKSDVRWESPTSVRLEDGCGSPVTISFQGITSARIAQITAHAAGVTILQREAGHYTVLRGRTDYADISLEDMSYTFYQGIGDKRKGSIRRILENLTDRIESF